MNACDSLEVVALGWFIGSIALAVILIMGAIWDKKLANRDIIGTKGPGSEFTAKSDKP